MKLINHKYGTPFREYRILTAKFLRSQGFKLHYNIPDRATISEEYIDINIKESHVVGSMMPMRTVAGISIDCNMFTWEPYVRPTNVRKLTPRNRREGSYAQRRITNRRLK